jgi:hypothetical protein
MSEAYKSIELPDTVPGIGYTLKHRNCVEKLIRYYCEKAVGKKDGKGEVFTKTDCEIMINRGKCHDMDKLLCSLSYPQLTADYFHRMLNGHHAESVIEPQNKSKYDWIEMLMDMESAHYTKADKQSGNAHTFVSTYQQYLLPYLEPYFELFSLKEIQTIQSIKQEVCKKYYETDLVNAIIDYMHTTRLHLLDGLSRIDDEGFMSLYNRPVPYRHKSTQKPQGTTHQRPNAVAQNSRSVMSREFVKGSLEAQIFDFDSICRLTAENVKDLNKKSLDVVEKLKDNKHQR